MKTIFAFLLSVCLLAACERTDRPARAASEDPEAERDRYEERIDARLDEFEFRFDGLESRLKGVDDATQEHLRLDIAELRDRKEALERKFNDLKRVSAESWLDIRRSLDQELDQLEIAYNVVSANNHGVDHAPPGLTDRPDRR